MSMSRERQGLHRFRKGAEPATEAQTRFEAARVLARQGNLDEARVLLRASVQTDPGLVDAWLQLAWLTENPRERTALLQHVLTLEPDHAQAKAELARLQPIIVPPPPARKPSTGRRSIWFLGSLVLLALLALAALLFWGSVENSLARLLPTATPIVTPVPTLAPD